ncbi:uncharacterized protein LOC109598871 isoform X2 [Aethina tumida]|uniref:uncharacterized protein LOC109598871 isoform X2 n=1 Tax=Aethina tumida TaxID=116153 RepID=UPI00096B11DA|nr:uncharacterized protein LOC109598871 isoform X2 [Aethina tumida]
MDKRHNKVVAWLQQIESERSSIITSLDYLIKKVNTKLNDGVKKKDYIGIIKYEMKVLDKLLAVSLNLDTFIQDELYDESDMNSEKSVQKINGTGDCSSNLTDATISDTNAFKVDETLSTTNCLNKEDLLHPFSNQSCKTSAEINCELDNSNNVPSTSDLALSTSGSAHSTCDPVEEDTMPNTQNLGLTENLNDPNVAEKDIECVESKLYCANSSVNNSINKELLGHVSNQFCKTNAEIKSESDNSSNVPSTSSLTPLISSSAHSTCDPEEEDAMPEGNLSKLTQNLRLTENLDGPNVADKDTDPSKYVIDYANSTVNNTFNDNHGQKAIVYADSHKVNLNNSLVMHKHNLPPINGNKCNKIINNLNKKRKNKGKNKKCYEILDQDPPEVGTECVFSHVECPDQFYIHLVGHNSLIDSMPDQIEKSLQRKIRYRNKDEAHNQLGRFCVAHTRDKIWCRCEILKWFLLYPPGSTHSNILSKWPQETIEALTQMSELFSDSPDMNKVFEIVYCGKFDDSLVVDLYNTSRNDAEETVGQILLDLGLAVQLLISDSDLNNSEVEKYETTE